MNSRIAVLVTVFALLMLAGCNDSPTNPNDESPDNPAVSVSSNTAYVPADAGAVELMVYNESDDVLIWGELLDVSSTVNWIDLVVTNEDFQPGDSTTLGIRVDRSGIGPGISDGEVELRYNDEVVQTIAVTMQTGTPDAVPIGVYTNFLRIPADVDMVDIGLINNSGESWGSPTLWPAWVTLPDFLTQSPYAQQVILEPGGSGNLELIVDRDFMSPGIYGAVIVLSWYGSPVQSVNIELEVGE